MQRAIEFSIGCTLRKVRTCDVTLLRAYYSSEAAATYGLAPRPMVMRNPDVESAIPAFAKSSWGRPRTLYSSIAIFRS